MLDGLFSAALLRHESAEGRTESYLKHIFPESYLGYQHFLFVEARFS